MNVAGGDERPRFQVLGVLAARRPDGRRVELRSPVRRRLLAMLLARPFDVIPADRLSDQLWFDDPPLGRGALHIQVSRLRRELSDGGASPITTVDSGYRFDCDPAEIDWLLFADLVQSARAGSQERPAEAVECFRRGLALWSASAFDDAVGVPIIDEQARVLDALRRSATLEMVALLHTLGRHDEIVTACAGLLAAEPYEEVVAAEVIRAMCRAGRVAEAIELGRRTVAALRDDLAVGPAPWFAELLHTLEARPSAVETWRPPVREPAEVPRSRTAPSLPAPMASGRFLGREHELARLLEVAGSEADGDAAALVEIVAPGGMGKTRLALEAAHRLAALGVDVRFGRGDAARRIAAVAMHDMFGGLVAGSVGALGGGDDTLTVHDVVERMTADIVASLPAHPVVLVVDDLHRADSVDRLVLDALLSSPALPCRLVVVATTRRSGVLARDADVHVALTGLPVVAIEPGVGDRDVAARLGALTGGQPLLLAPLLANLQRVPVTDRKAAVEHWGRGGGALALESVVVQQLSGCSPRAATLLAGLAAASAPVHLSTVQALVDGDEAAAAAALVELIEAGLAVENSSGHATVAHELLGEVVRATVADEVDERVRRVLARGQTMDEVWVPTEAASVTDSRHATMVLAAGREALRSAAFDEARRVGELLLSLRSNPSIEAGAALVAGTACAALDDREAADRHFSVALTAGRAVHDDEVIVDAVAGLLGHWNLGDGPSSGDRELVDSALSEVTDPTARCRLLARAVGLHLGRGPLCRAWADEAVRLSTMLDDPVAAAVAATAHGYAGLGHRGLAERRSLLTRAARSATVDLGLDRWVALLSHHFVAACEDNDPDGAAWSLQRHQHIAERTRRPVHVWRSQVLTGTLHMLREELDDALEAVDQAAATARRHRLPDGRATQLLQQSAVAVLGGPSPAFVARGVRLAAGTPHPLTLALDAILHHPHDPDGSFTALESAAAMSRSIQTDYLSNATYAAIARAAVLCERDDILQQVAAQLRAVDVIVPVIAVGTAIVPAPPGLLSHG